MPCLVSKNQSEHFVQDYFIDLVTGSTVNQWIDSQVKKIKVDPNSFVGSFSFHGKSYYLKAYYARSFSGRCINRLGLSRPFRQWKKINLFCNEIVSPKPLMVISAADFTSAYYVTDFLEGSRDLNSCLTGDNKFSDDRASKILYDCGLMIGHIHQRAWFHGDLKWTNFLVDGKDQISIIDLDGLKRSSFSGRSSMPGKDLARFILNAEEFLENPQLLDYFLKGYCEQRNIDKSNCVSEFYPFLMVLRKKHQKKYGVRGKHFF